MRDLRPKKSQRSGCRPSAVVEAIAQHRLMISVMTTVLLIPKVAYVHQQIHLQTYPPRQRLSPWHGSDRSGGDNRGRITSTCQERKTMESQIKLELARRIEIREFLAKFLRQDPEIISL